MDVFVPLGVILFAYMMAGMVFNFSRKDNSLIDIEYGLGFLLLAGATLKLSEGNPTLISWILFSLVLLWALRLSGRIFLRHNGEDWRYQQWRTEWMKKGFGYFFVRSFFQIYILQGVIIFLISIPVIMGIQAATAGSVSQLTLVGIIIWAIGFMFETIGDAQLAAFIKDPKNKGKLITTGLWKYTRHPNYFGEAVLWWGIWSIALSVGAPVWTIIGPLVITVLVRFVSGVPMLEKKWEGRSDWERYAKKTNAFFPWWPKRT